MLDLSQLNALLASLGPWGIGLGIGLTLLAQWVKKRQGIPTPTPNPAPGPTPNPDPLAPVLPQPAPARPLLDMLQKLLLALLAKRAQPASTYGAAPTDPIEDELIRICGDLMKRDAREVNSPRGC